MTYIKIASIFSFRSLVIAATVAVFAVAPASSHAVFMLSLVQSGSDVVMTGSGSLNLSALVYIGPNDPQNQIVPTWNLNPQNASAVGGNLMPVALWGGQITAPTRFGSGGTTLATSTSGLAVGVNGGMLFVPLGYTSGTALTDSATFANATFSSLGFTPGTYIYSWGAGATADTFTVTSVAPEPSTWVLGAAGLLLLGVSLRRRSA